MNQIERIHRAEYFFCEMAAAQGVREQFRLNLSAFLSAARCVLESVRMQSEARIGGYAWYERAMNQNLVLAFFRHRRNASVCAHPLEIPCDVAGRAADELDISPSEAVSVAVFDVGPPAAQGGSASTGARAFGAAACVPVTICTAYKFEGWSGAEDVYQLCALYLRELRSIVADGQRQGYVEQP